MHNKFKNYHCSKIIVIVTFKYISYIIQGHTTHVLKISPGNHYRLACQHLVAVIGTGKDSIDWLISLSSDLYLQEYGLDDSQ